jgi:hypothetical protein
LHRLLEVRERLLVLPLLKLGDTAAVLILRPHTTAAERRQHNGRQTQSNANWQLLRGHVATSTSAKLAARHPERFQAAREYRPRASAARPIFLNRNEQTNGDFSARRPAL